MKQEEIDRLIKKGILIPDYFLEDKYVLVETNEMVGLVKKCIDLKREGKEPVVVFFDGLPVRERITREHYTKNMIEYRNLTHITRHIIILDGDRLTINEYEELKREWKIKSIVGDGNG